jgi:hypothetical protein
MDRASASLCEQRLPLECPVNWRPSALRFYSRFPVTETRTCRTVPRTTPARLGIALDDRRASHDRDGGIEIADMERMFRTQFFGKRIVTTAVKNVARDSMARFEQAECHNQANTNQGRPSLRRRILAEEFAASGRRAAPLIRIAVPRCYRRRFYPNRNVPTKGKWSDAARVEAENKTSSSA